MFNPRSSTFNQIIGWMLVASLSGLVGTTSWLVACHRPVQTPPRGDMGKENRLIDLLNDPARRNKLDGALIVRLQELIRNNQPHEPLSVLVQISGNLSEPVRTRLSDAGLFIQVQVGDVLTGSIRASDLGRLLACQEVKKVALSQERRLTKPTPTP